MLAVLLHHGFVSGQMLGRIAGDQSLPFALRLRGFEPKWRKRRELNVSPMGLEFARDIGRTLYHRPM